MNFVNRLNPRSADTETAAAVVFKALAINRLQKAFVLGYNHY